MGARTCTTHMKKIQPDRRKNLRRGPISTGGCAFIVTTLEWRAPRSTLVAGSTENPATCEHRHFHTVGSNRMKTRYGTAHAALLTFTTYTHARATRKFIVTANRRLKHIVLVLFKNSRDEAFLSLERPRDRYNQRSS